MFSLPASPHMCNAHSQPIPTPGFASLPHRRDRHPIPPSAEHPNLGGAGGGLIRAILPPTSGMVSAPTCAGVVRNGGSHGSQPTPRPRHGCNDSTAFPSLCRFHLSWRHFLVSSLYRLESAIHGVPFIESAALPMSSLLKSPIGSRSQDSGRQLLSFPLLYAADFIGPSSFEPRAYPALRMPS
jgi:hypothetical protein